MVITVDTWNLPWIDALGDDGIDIKVTHGSRVRIFQLKYYQDGFPTTAHKGRRKSIRQSFARALQHQSWE
ncbi:hypothetical protein ABT116_41335 [Streptomyces sp. NPDC002130]|uniref:hypothetical protein n=1 Tax=Streptomyces sp. NPDC002130 TaxID=3155568 RepID=UPI00332C5346